ncbi:MAG: aminotransferase class V-fold PLP-dependent enzyme [Desulfovibrionaceae bacterium]
MDCASLRDEFPITQDSIFFNNAAVSPLPLRTERTVCDLARRRALAASADFPQWMQEVEEARRLCARLTGAAVASEIAFTANTSHSLSFAAAGLGLGPGDAVAVTRPDFPSVVYPWLGLRDQGVEVRFIERQHGRFSVDDAQRILDDSVRLLCVSSVDWVSGFMADLPALGALCRERGVLFCVDAIQSLGAIPLDVEVMRIDLLAAGSHKWLLSPMGVGVLYVSQRVRERVQPRVLGWRSVENAEDFGLDFQIKNDARAFEAGTLNLAGILGLKTSLDMMLGLGLPAIQQRVHGLGGQIIRGLKERSIKVATPENAAERAGIVSFDPPSNTIMLHRYLADQGVVCSLRQGLIRLAPHFYNDSSDVEKFFKILDEML